MEAIREIPQTAGYKKGDVLVLFGELFSKGYANGLVAEAEKMGMTVVRSTVGRRDTDGNLRPLNEEEISTQSKPFINIPLEAGFDMEKASSGQSPCDQLKGMKINDWNRDILDWESVQESKANSIDRFRKNVSTYMDQLAPLIPKGANVLFAHTMAGGVPRARILMPAMNKVFKGRGDRYIESQKFWNTDIGKLCEINFNEVTAYTFKHLVELSEPIRKSVENGGGKTSYVAYGYHGTEILIDDTYQWQTYTPYVQGWAKMELEKLMVQFSAEGINCSVYNCPEILTNSSSIFQGVEVSLYPLLGAIQKEGVHSAYCENVLNQCINLVKEEHSLEEVMTFTSEYVKDPLIQKHSEFESWPDHNSKKQMEFMLDSSQHLIAMHRDPKDLITFRLSEEVFKASGQLMLHNSWDTQKPVLWLNHDIIAKQMSTEA